MNKDELFEQIVEQMKSQHANVSANINIDYSLPELSHISPKDQDNSMPLPKGGAKLHGPRRAASPGPAAAGAIFRRVLPISDVIRAP